MTGLPKPIFERPWAGDIPEMTPGIIKKHGPGPSDEHPNIRRALAAPTLPHLDAEFASAMDEIQDMLRKVFQTQNQMTLPISGTGSSGMEALVANLIEPYDKVLVVENGVFGGRIKDDIARVGGEPTALEIEWGTVPTAEAIEEAMKKEDYKALFLVHAETSTGALQPDMKAIANIAHGHGAFFMVDCVTSLAGREVDIDGWGVDAAYSGTQKCIGVPPGLAPITINEKAMNKVMSRKTPVPNWSLNLAGYLGYWTGAAGRKYHHTAPVNMLFALHEGLRLILEEGLENRWKRHAENAAALQAGLEALGCTYIVKEQPQRLPMLHAVYLPEGADAAALQKEIRQNDNIEIGGGLGKFAGKAWRVGLMAESSRRENVDRLLGVIGTTFAKHGLAGDAQIGAKAAAASLHDQATA